jgi:hypothetical protein
MWIRKCSCCASPLLKKHIPYNPAAYFVYPVAETDIFIGNANCIPANAALDGDVVDALTLVQVDV